MRNFKSILRVVVILAAVWLVTEYMLSPNDGSLAIVTYPELSVFMVFLAVVLVATEVLIASVRSFVDAVLTPEQQALRNQELQKVWYVRLYRKLLDQKPIEQEKEIEMDHEYDGIRELDNNLPPWWVYMFYATMIFAGIYLVHYHMLGGFTQEQELDAENQEAQVALEAYKKNAPDLITADNVTLLTDAKSLEEGKKIFQANCVACHGAEAQGGIGPNLTDEYWILGGGIKNVFHTISEGGREGKGMISWKKSGFSPTQIQQVSSYVISLQGTNPANGKDPEGDLWEADK